MPHTTLLTGATGYIGGRLLRRLEELGYRVRCLARKPESLQGRISPSTEVFRGDVLDGDSIREAMKGVDTAYYLVHSMGTASDEHGIPDRNAALQFGRLAKELGVQKIICFTSLCPAPTDSASGTDTSQSVGSLLAASGVPVIEFRSAVIIGSGSISFEIIRASVEKLPMIIISRWMTIPTQPVSIGNVLDFLCLAPTLDATNHKVIDLGGSDTSTFEELLREYARQRGIHRLMVRFPFHLPWLSSLRIGLTTPVYPRLGRKLIESLTCASVVKGEQPPRSPSIRLRGVAEAISEALNNEDREFAETHWWRSRSSTGSSSDWSTVRFGNRLIFQRRVTVSCSPENAFAAIQKIGGKNGWYFANWLWELRGIMDLMVGGVGLRRGRKHPVHLAVGDVIDWWRVETFVPGRTLRLIAEMKLPGRAWLVFNVQKKNGEPEILQTAIFDPVGLLGLAYWYAVYPVHVVVFWGMLRNLSRAAESFKN